MSSARTRGCYLWCVDSRDPLGRLRDVGLPGGPSADEAQALFARVRGTPEEGPALALLLARHAGTPLPEPLLAAVAAALINRGEDAAAIRVLSQATGADARLMLADLLHRAGDLAGALAQVEYVLFRDIDWPGARERHIRWRETLGRDRIRPARTPRGAIAAAAPTDSPFLLIREVGRGGSGAVYEAEDRELGRRVALKIYHRPESDRPKLLHEARVAVGLSGAGVVRIFDLDPEHGWLAMEWARLGALRALLGEPDVSRPTAIGRWGRPLARALAQVHAAGWVHNDVKPANILFRSPDSPLLTDFGAARRHGDASPLGSPGYMSPERIAGRVSEPSEDVYGFGCVLREVLDASATVGASGVEREARDAWVERDARDAWGQLASLCLGRDGHRPRDGKALSVIVDQTAGRQDAWRG